MSGEDHYSNETIDFLGDLWGDGYMSPGGPEEVARVLDGLDFSGKTGLDIGCGSGAIAVQLVARHGAAHVTGIDVEDPVCEAAKVRAAAAGLADKITIQKVDPGPFPCADGAFDFVFSKDSIIHIPDKEALAAEAFRALKPGGWFAASDWLISHDNEPSAEMAAYIASEDLDFAMASPARYEAAMRAAGFEDVQLVNRNPWYALEAQRELGMLTGAEGTDWAKKYGDDFIEEQVDIWTRLVGVLKSGEHCPHHIRGRKPR
ncbi:MAG: methyltransferase domain-containing protein [Pseudomonadota bacterium]